jgi:hypothetical protein
MDPTIDVLTIHPAAWAALLEGLARSLIYGLTIIATLVVVMTTLFGSFERRVAERGAVD